MTLRSERFRRACRRRGVSARANLADRNPVDQHAGKLDVIEGPTEADHKQARRHDQ
jgi:hypothetical protein